LREAAKEAAGGEMITWESPDMSPDLAESFWRNVLAYESAEETCHFIQLTEMGLELPAPENLSDEELSAKLWEVINGLAKLNVFLSQTDHLSDRELCGHLWHDSLREITMDLPPDSGWTCHLDILGGCSSEDLQIYMKYYADEEYREQWRKDWPDEIVPDHVDPLYDRDSKLPKPPAL
jgi:hypothetical protein